jgi:hypothetical protein
MVEATHGKSIVVKETEFPSLQAVAKAFGIGYSALKDRINRRGLTPEQAVSEPLAATSFNDKYFQSNIWLLCH